MTRSRPPDRSRRLSQRVMLRWGAVLGLSALAGCTKEIGQEFPPNEKIPLSGQLPDLPVEERTAVLEAGITALADADIATEEEFVTALEAEGIAVESLETIHDVLTLEYSTRQSPNEGVLHELGLIAGAYAALVETRYHTTVLEVTIANERSSTYGVAEIAAEDAERYNASEYSAMEYGELVASSIMSKRDPPAVETVPSI